MLPFVRHRASGKMPATFSLISCVRGYHVYKDMWKPPVGETVNCEREGRNPEDPYAVALRKDDVIKYCLICYIAKHLVLFA